MTENLHTEGVYNIELYNGEVHSLAVLCLGKEMS